MEYSFNKSLGYLARVISRNLGINLEKKLLNNKITITAEQWSVISITYHHNNSNQNAIAKALNYDKVRVLRILNKLEAENIIFRKTDSNDKRARMVSLTKKGIDIYNRISPIAQETLDDAFLNLTSKEISVYMKLTQKIIANLTS